MSFERIPAITVKGVSKLFHKQSQRTFKELLPAIFGGKDVVDSFWALKDVSFEVMQGETLGIIGHNGSGKSTILKLIAGVSKPSKGKITVHGRLAPLIELGAGFHPELTGRENIFLNGIILGMTRKGVESCIEDIISFAEISDHIDEPVKHYSSGMYLRLAFSVAIHTKPSILLVDEILAVGDPQFQEKCFRRMDQFKQQGVTIIYISHSLETVRSFCDRVMLLEEGRIKKIGAPDAVIQAFD